MTEFAPQFISDAELAQYGLPDVSTQADILNLVQLASAFIDEACGRLDGDGNGSLVYTTYVQRCLLQTRNRNLILLPMKPITPVSSGAMLALSGQMTPSRNNWFTGVLPNTVTTATGLLSGIVAASGRYGYTRQDMSIAYPDLFAFINPLNLVTMFGGPAPWVPIDVGNADYDPKTGEVWIPAGLQLQRYSEVLITYNSGYDPNRMPRAIKHVCAALTKRLLASDGTTGLTRMTVARSGVNVGFYENLLDPTLDQMLTPYRAVRAY